MTYEMSPRVSGGLGLEKARTLQGVGLGLGHHSPPTLYSLIGDFGKSPILSPPLLYIVVFLELIVINRISYAMSPSRPQR